MPIPTRAVVETVEPQGKGHLARVTVSFQWPTIILGAMVLSVPTFTAMFGEMPVEGKEYTVTIEQVP